MEGLSRDTWIATHSPISPEKLHALGYVNFVWNVCEHELFSLFATVMKIPEREAWVLVHDLGDISICLRIKEIARYRYPGTPYLDLIENALEVYEVCRANRNQLTHFTIGIAHDKFELVLKRASKKPNTRDTQSISESVWDMRRVGRDINRLRGQLAELWAVETFGGGELPLPSKLRVPAPLWTPRPQAPKAPKRQPQPSRQKRKSDDQA